ncbi:GNAT family N-acetyltransferase [Maribacter algicola]|uniref:GNAT family N-acetyltransferase n=1 Tax=Maribacter algicola TaxID=2498892 RepID=A0A3R8WIF4_9FLAO|nr:GNAT family N-acetyltransferase [Maribacter algicola]
MASIIAVTTTAHIATVAHLAQTIWTDHYTPIIGALQVDYMLEKYQSETAISNQIKDGYQYYFIKTDVGHAGYFAFSLHNNYLFLSKFYVLKNMRGSGLGTLALSFIENKAKELHLPKIRLTVNKYNSKSISAYEKMGFANVESIVQDIGNGYVMDDYVLEKNIT